MKLSLNYNGEQILNVPNTITIGRLALMVGGSVSVILGGPNIHAALMYATGSLGDGLDGIAARVLKQKTEFGKRLDPLADATGFVTGLTALTIASPEIYERMLLASTLVVQTLYSSHLMYKWKGIADEKKRAIGPSMLGKTKTAIMMISLTKLMGGPHFLQDLQQFMGTYRIPFLEGNLEQLDNTLHLASLSGVGIGIFGTLCSWYSYNKKANALLKNK